MKKLVCLFSCTFLLSITAFCQVTDLKVLQSDIAQCDTAGLINVPITIVNNGSNTVVSGSSVSCTYQINGGGLNVETLSFSSDLTAGDTAVLIFGNTYNFNMFATYNCMLAIDFSGDDTVANDTAFFTSTFYSMPGYSAHSNDTSICQGDQAYLMMELEGNGPWLLDIIMDADTVWGLPVFDSVLATYLTPDTLMQFTLLNVTDVNGCMMPVGLGIIITVNEYPEVYLGTDTTMCAGDTLWLDAGNPGASYTWWAGSGAQTWPADTANWSGALGFQTAWVEVNLNACVSRDSIVIEWELCPDAVQEIAADHLSIFPNPSQGFLTLTGLSATYSQAIEIVTPLGLCVYNRSVPASTDKLMMDLQDLKKGFYFVILRSGEENKVAKLLLQ